MNTLLHLATVGSTHEAVAASEKVPVFIFKHSTQCGVSSRAIREFEAFLGSEAPGFGYYQVNVIESRAASDELENLALVRHESPQVLLMWGSECVWHASHGRIKSEELRLQATAIRKKQTS
ncbi:MAG: ral stress protein [Fibrobacteres bacterium]|nr:ral stress protein [Fibrobacterota bacterium]